MATGNLWALLKGVIAQPAQQRATVLARVGNVYDVQYMGGNISQASSTAAYDVGAKVFIQGDKITGQAPDLPFTEIEV